MLIRNGKPPPTSASLGFFAISSSNSRSRGARAGSLARIGARGVDDSSALSKRTWARDRPFGLPCPYRCTYAPV
jgi:hypothetical protein